MKKISLLASAILMMLWSVSLPAKADTFPTPVIHTTVYVVPSPFDPELDPEGNRKPSRPLQCTISREEGISVAGYPAEFTSYGIWDADGIVCLGDCSSESDFIDTLFSMPSGEYQIRLATDDCVLVGYVTL